MNKRIDICSSCSKNREIVNIKYNLCTQCNKTRLTEQRRSKSSSTQTSNANNERSYAGNSKVPLSTSKRSLSRVSTKRKKQDEEYKRVKEEKKAYMIEKKFYRCLLCNTKLNPEDDEYIDWHHIVLRTDKNLTDWKNLAPVHRTCHTMYHSSTASDLLDTPWYNHFLSRLRDGANNNEYFREAFNNELRRLQKSGIYDQEMFLKEYING